MKISIVKNKFGKMLRRIINQICSMIWLISNKLYLVGLSCLNKLPNKQEDDVVSNGKEVYLTFDDGPGPYIHQLLKILEKYNVKATFFVTGRRDIESITKIAQAGHAIGNHSFSHQYAEIYASEEAFFKDLEQMEKVIIEKTGKKTQLMRFPGGSSNTVSRKNPGIMTRLSKMVEEKGYTYFDWNVDSDDAMHSRISGKVYKNIIEGIQKTEHAVVLQHDVQNYSVAVVENVIIWGLRHGYVFLPLTEKGPEVHHKINN